MTKTITYGGREARLFNLFLILNVAASFASVFYTPAVALVVLFSSLAGIVGLSISSSLEDLPVSLDGFKKYLRYEEAAARTKEQLNLPPVDIDNDFLAEKAQRARDARSAELARRAAELIDTAVAEAK